MNKTHRIVWSEARQGYVVAHENAAACGKPSSTRKGVVSAVAAALLALGAGQAQAATDCLAGGAITIDGAATLNCALASGDSLTVSGTGSIIDMTTAAVSVGAGVASITVDAVGVITGGVNGINIPVNASISGDITNSGTISSTGGNAINFSGGGILTGDIINNNIISSLNLGIALSASTISGSIINNSGGNISGIYLSTTSTVTRGINNSGGISGVNVGIELRTHSTVTRGITNSGTISGSSGGKGIYISSSTISGGVTNSGSISAGGSSGRGISLYNSTISGGVTNSGTISGGFTARGISITSGAISSGVTNSGTISGGRYGIQLNFGPIVASTISGGIINSGTISGGSNSSGQYSIYAHPSATLDGITVTGTNTAKFIGAVRAPNTPMLVATGASYTMDNGNRFTVSGFTTDGTLGVAAGGTATVTGNYTQNSSSTFRTNVTNSTTFGKLTVTGTAGLPTAAQFVVATGDPATCGGITAGGTIAGVLKSGGAMTSTTFATVVDDCDGLNFTAQYNSGTSAIDLVASSAGPSTWIVTGASGGNGTVSCDSPVTNNGYATCTGTASGGYSLASAAGCGTTTVSGNTITAGPVTAACTVTGTFAASGTYAVTAVANPVAGGSVSCTPASGIASGGGSTCSGTANPGYTFTNWGGDCSSAGSSATCTITGITSAKSVTANFRAATTLVEPITPEVPVVPLIPPLVSLPALPGVGNSGRVFLNLAEGAGPSMTGCLRTTLNDLLGPDWQYQGQSADGGGRLKRATDIISFYPIEASSNTTYGLGQGAGLYLRGGNPMSVVTGCGTFVTAPALYSLGEFGALLNAAGQTAQINAQGVMTFPVGPLTYAVRPNYWVTQGTPGAPALSTGADGQLRFTDSAGNSQILYPAFLDPELLGTQVSQAVGGWTVVQTDGTALLTLLNGQQFVLTPDLALGAVPAGTMTSWWQDGPNHYRFRNSGFSNTSQGFSVRP